MIENPRVALVYDWLDTSLGGAEQVLLALHQLYPQAPLFTAYQTKAAPEWCQELTIKTSFLQRWPFFQKHKSLAALLMPLAFESFNFQDFDVVISISSFAAKGIITQPNQFHLCYLLTPTRFLYEQSDQYLAAKWTKFPLVKQLLNYFQKKLLAWDQIAAWRPDEIIPIAQVISNRCQQVYRRSTQPPIYPPLNFTALHSSQPELSEVEREILAQLPTNFDLIVARQVNYKRLDLAIRATVTAQRRLVLVGGGPQAKALRRLARQLDPQQQYLSFLGSISESLLIELYRRAQLFLMPGQEDFGITALEATSFGLPILIQHQSGAAEIIPPTLTYRLPEESVAAILAGYDWWEKDRPRISTAQIAKNSLKYDTAAFQNQFAAITTKLYAHYQTSLVS